MIWFFVIITFFDHMIRILKILKFWFRGINLDIFMPEIRDGFIFWDFHPVKCWGQFEVRYFDPRSQGFLKIEVILFRDFWLICIPGIGDIPTKSNLGIFRILTIPLDQLPESAENFALRISVVNWRIIATRTELTNYSLSQKFRI